MASATLIGQTSNTELTVGLSGATAYRWEASADVIFSSTTIVDTDATFDYSSYTDYTAKPYIRPVVTYNGTNAYSDIAVIKVYKNISGATRIDITFGSDIESIGDYAFTNCISLANIDFGSVTTIGREAFYTCSSLATVVIGDSVTSIGTQAFFGCTSLANVYFLGAKPSFIGANNFLSNSGDTAYYRAGQTGWDSTTINNISTVIPIPTITSITTSKITASVAQVGFSLVFYISSDDGLTWTHHTYLSTTANADEQFPYTFETGKTYKVSTIANYYNATPDYSIYCKTLDLQSPTLQITSDKSLIKSEETATLTFTFSETVTGFDSSDVTTSNGTLGTLSGSGTTYTAIFTPTTNYRGTATISIAAGKFSDAAGNQNIYTALSIAILVNVTFRVDVSNVTESFTTVFLNGTFNGWNGTSNPMTNLGNGIWEITISLAAGSYEYKFTLDGWTSPEMLTSGSDGTVTTSGFTNRGITVGDSDIVLDAVGFGLSTPLEKIPPTVEIVSDKASLKSGETATLTFTFSETVTGFSQEDVSITNGALSNFTENATASNISTYTAIFTPTANVEGTATISIAANQFSDAAGNHNTAPSNTISITVDTIVPNTPSVTGTASGTISGTAEANSTLVATKTNNVTESVSVDNTGKWRLNVASIDSYVFRARDTAGNVSNPTTFSSNSFSFRYPSSSAPYRFTAGSPIKSIGMSSAGRISGDTSTSFKIKPALPPGLSFSRRTGKITGTPIAPLAATKYTITSVSTVYASRSAKITIEVL